MELAILNTLIGKDDLEQAFLSIIRAYPKVRAVLPILIALRIKNSGELSIISSVGTSQIQSMSMIFDPAVPLTPEIEGKLITSMQVKELS